jgi:hypothetical protein
VWGEAPDLLPGQEGSHRRLVALAEKVAALTRAELAAVTLADLAAELRCPYMHSTPAAAQATSVCA